MPLFVNKMPIKFFRFSGGECHVSVEGIRIGAQVELLAYLYSSDDVMSLLLAVDAIRRVNPHALIDLQIPYMPYARQDRVCNEGEALSIKVMASLINGLNCHSVTILDPHSDVTAALIERVRIVLQSELVSRFGEVKELLQSNEVTLLAPDAGAEKKVRAVANTLLAEGIESDVAYASKSRDVRTGHIIKTNIPGDVAGKNYLIVDDICDGGGTFINLARELKAQGSEDIYLYVTHGIFSKGLEPLKEVLSHVYCQHSFTKFSEPEFLTTMEDVSCM